MNFEDSAHLRKAAESAGGIESVLSAKETAIRYYQLLNKGAYVEAYRMLSHRERERYGTIEQWQKAVLSDVHVEDVHFIYIEPPTEVDKHLYIGLYVYFDDHTHPSSVKMKLIWEHDEWRVYEIENED